MGSYIFSPASALIDPFIEKMESVLIITTLWWFAVDAKITGNGLRANGLFQ